MSTALSLMLQNINEAVTSDLPQLGKCQAGVISSVPQEGGEIVIHRGPA